MNISESSFFVNGFPTAEDYNEIISDKLRLFDIISFIFLVVITLAGNSIVLGVFFMTRKLRTLTNSFVLNMAATDFMIGALIMPNALMQKISDAWRFGAAVCNVWASLDYLFCANIIYTLCAISFHRYLAVTQPLNYWRNSGSKIWYIRLLVGVWITALLITAVPFGRWFEISDRYGTLVCRYRPTMGFLSYTSVLLFIIPFGFMFVMYIGVFLALKRRRASKIQQSIVMSSGEPRTSLSIARREQEEKKLENHAYSVMFLVMITFFVCWLPYFSLHFAELFFFTGDEQELTCCLIWVSLFNAAVNPFIYCFYYPEFLKALKLALRKAFCRSQRVQ